MKMNPKPLIESFNEKLLLLIFLKRSSFHSFYYFLLFFCRDFFFCMIYNEKIYVSKTTDIFLVFFFSLSCLEIYKILFCILKDNFSDIYIFLNISMKTQLSGVYFLYNHDFADFFYLFSLFSPFFSQINFIRIYFFHFYHKIFFTINII